MRVVLFFFLTAILTPVMVGGQTTKNNDSSLINAPFVTISVSFEEELDSCLVDQNAQLTAHVTIHNNSDSSICFYENWNSYGYYNFTFELETEDSTYILYRPKIYWYRNFPSYTCVAPFDSVQFHFVLMDTLTAKERIEPGWMGYPIDPPQFGTIRVNYTLNKEYAILPIRDLSKIDYSNHLDSEDAGLIQSINHDNQTIEYRYLSLFSHTLVSEKKRIQFRAGY